MAEKIRDGISRELRYVEYKLRKRKTDKPKHKKKNGGFPDHDISSIPDDFKQSAPTNHGEEDVQLEVALAMSREEAKEKEKAETSDKIRLEMALKESADVAVKVMAKHSPTHVPDSSANQSSDPWGAPAAIPKQNIFDPFANNKPATDNGFGIDAWGTNASIPAPPAPTSQPAVDPWGSSASSKQTTDVWGPSAPPPPTNADLWSSGEPTNQKLDPWNTGPALTNTSNDPWNTAPQSGIKVAENFDPFKTQSFASPAPDPFQEFSQLSIQPSQPAPTTSLDLFASDVMVPQSVNDAGGKKNMTAGMGSEIDGNKAGAFLGDNANLVNIDSLIRKPATDHSYIALNTPSLGASRNPFNQKGPSPSLNQMKPVVESPFPGQSAYVGMAPNMMPPSAVGYPSMGVNMAMGGMVPGQQVYGFPGTVQSTPNQLFAPQSISSTPANQQNQLLF